MLRRSRKLPAQALLGEVERAVEQFRSGIAVSDDLTVLVMRRQ